MIIGVLELSLSLNSLSEENNTSCVLELIHFIFIIKFFFIDQICGFRRNSPTVRREDKGTYISCYS